MEEHGGNPLAAARRLGRPPEEFLDFSASINPLGLPRAAREALRGSRAAAERYPDPQYRELTAALAAYLGVDPECLVVANGASGALWNLLLARRPEAVRIFRPAFSEYARGARAAGAKIREADLGDSFTPPATGQPGELVFWNNPHNPSGAVVEAARLEPWAEAVLARGAIPVLDEAFVDFLPDPRRWSLRCWVARHPGPVILGSLTKYFALAGLRLGYLLAAPEVAGALREAAEPWRVNAAAAAAGAAALGDAAFVAASRRLLPRWREELRAKLQALPGVEVYPSQVNFLLLRLPRPGISEALARRGILVRDCANFPPLSPGHVRVAVRRPGENRRLVRALGEVLR
ncbi:MAG: threonine-phosphate decarboxylase CobD [Thermaerobacter sp.]|jgi:threonine-phosphate decarboxylase|nr:threonine-phosphate decarboxylase CobD [Thermaerobacter sp.]